MKLILAEVLSPRVAREQRWIHRLLLFAMVLLTADLLADPGDMLLHAKIPLFALVMLLWMVQTPVWRRVGRLNTLVGLLIVSVIVPLAWMLLTVLTAGADLSNVENLVAYPKAFLFIPLLLVVLNEKIPLNRIVSRLSVLLAVVTIALVVLSIAFPVAFVGAYLFANEKGLAIISEGRDQFGIGVGQFYYKTSPIMLFGLIYFLHRRLVRGGARWFDLPLSALLFLALLFSGARANLLAASAAIAAVLVVGVKKRFGLTPATILGLVLCLAPVALFSNNLFNPAETSNQIKLMHYESYAQLLNEHPAYLFTGQGEGTRFYSSGFQSYTYVTELSYLELVRQFGLPATILLIGFLFAPLLFLVRRGSLYEERGYVAIAYGAYLLVSATNPLLVSSTGMLVIVMVWVRALEDGENGSLAEWGEPLVTA